MSFAADIIWYLHVGVVFLIAGVPFFGTPHMLSIYKLVIPFLFFHWATNNDTCVLTKIEQLLRKCPQKEAFLQKFLEPIYILPMDTFGHVTKLIVLLLFYYVMFKTRAFVY